LRRRFAGAQCKEPSGRRFRQLALPGEASARRAVEELAVAGVGQPGNVGNFPATASAEHPAVSGQVVCLRARRTLPRRHRPHLGHAASGCGVTRIAAEGPVVPSHRRAGIAKVGEICASYGRRKRLTCRIVDGELRQICAGEQILALGCVSAGTALRPLVARTRDERLALGGHDLEHQVLRVRIIAHDLVFTGTVGDRDDLRAVIPRNCGQIRQNERGIEGRSLVHADACPGRETHHRLDVLRYLHIVERPRTDV
jgi:hypothetical protein